MHTRLSQANPYGHDRYGFAWEHIPANKNAHLDFGCHDGKFMQTLKAKHIGRLVGVDISKAAVEEGRRLYPELEFIHISQTAPLSFADETFDSITLLDVLEHVSEQTELLKELHRVLKHDGKLMVTVPGRHFFSFLDMGNFKFVFPKLHRWYYCFTHSKEEYEHRYVSNPENLIGDISAHKAWHEHFKRRKLQTLLEQCGFSVIEFDGSGFFGRLYHNIRYFFRWAKPIDAFFDGMNKLDARLFESTHLFCLAEKQQS